MHHSLIEAGYLIALIVIGIQGLMVGIVTAVTMWFLHWRARPRFNRAILIFLITQLLYFPLALFLKFAVMGLISETKHPGLTRFFCGVDCASTFDLDFKTELLVKAELRLYLIALIIVWLVAIVNFVRRRRRIIAIGRGVSS